MNDFENDLKRQPLRRVPAAWRAQVLRAAEMQAPPRWSWMELLWPSPKAWGGLAAAWVLIICSHVALRENGQPDAAGQTAAQIRMATEERRHLQAEMEEASLHMDAESPKPRSDGGAKLKAG